MIFSILIFIYIVGVIGAIITLTIRHHNCTANLFESAYAPVLIASSWIYVITIILNHIDRMKS